MVPIALGRGPGAGARASLAKVIIGGQMLSLLLALLVTPVSYSLLDGVGRFVSRLWQRIGLGTQAPDGEGRGPQSGGDARLNHVGPGLLRMASRLPSAGT
jgi:hypothetical protein